MFGFAVLEVCGGRSTAIHPEDAALYLCGCGKSFTAAVSTWVTCPACGHEQAW
jgi:hypothetical protein